MTRLRVFCRARPWAADEDSVVELNDASLSTNGPDGRRRDFFYDRVFDQNDSQESVFKHVCSDVLSDVFGGFNATVFAYGQTGSGKTHTMMGSPTDEGLVPRCVKGLFDKIPQFKRASVTVSFLEIYNETLRDLLSSGRKPELLTDADGNVVVKRLEERGVDSADDALEALYAGIKLRATGKTKMNDLSSRSHIVFTINVSFTTSNDAVIRSKLNLVDLAGSERQKQAKTHGERLNEANHINTSLMTLGRVMHALAEGGPTVEFARYRDSKLTMLLKDSLCGNSKTRLIANISCSKSNKNETLSTLHFSQNARKIVTKAKANVENLNVDKEEQTNKSSLEEQVLKATSTLRARVEAAEMRSESLRKKNESLKKANVDLENKLQKYESLNAKTSVMENELRLKISALREDLKKERETKRTHVTSVSHRALADAARLRSSESTLTARLEAANAEISELKSQLKNNTLHKKIDLLERTKHQVLTLKSENESLKTRAAAKKRQIKPPSAIRHLSAATTTTEPSSHPTNK